MTIYITNLKIFNIKYIYIILLSIILINYINNDIKICLCVIVKNENRYLREFIEHYKNIGYDKIFIYDNNDKNFQSIKEFIRDYIRNKFVEIIDFQERSPNSSPQIDAYKDCYLKNNKIYNWLSFFDIDEYIEINQKYRSIKYFLKDKLFKYCQNIKINWLYYYDEKKLYYENKPLQERIKEFRLDNPVNIHIKSIVRGNLPLNYWEKAQNPHTSQLNFNSCSSSGKIIQYDSPFNQPPDYLNAKLKHYSYKSFEEYCLKLKRGIGSCPKNISNQIIKKEYLKIYSDNRNNPEKMKIIHKIFNDSFYF